MTLLERIRTASPGTRVSLLSPCGDGCSSAESIGDVEELQAVLKTPADAIPLKAPDGETYYIDQKNVKAAIDNAAQSSHGDLTGRCLGNWEVGFEEGRRKTIKKICERLGLKLPENRRRLRGEL